MSFDLPGDAVFICCPTHDQRMVGESAVSLYVTATERMRPLVCTSNSSLLNHNCNVLLSGAMNLREQHGLKWFAMLHSDVVPERWWLDKLVFEAEKHDADFVSAHCAIKDNTGMTSTAVCMPANEWMPNKLSWKQIADLPETFGVEAINREPDAMLCCNTGCCVMRLDRPWLDPSKVFFDSPNRMVNIDGKWNGQVIPEDWHFTKSIAKAGGRVMATRAVATRHFGGAEFWADALDPGQLTAAMEAKLK